MKIERVQQLVCEVWGVTLHEIKSQSRDPGISDARHASMALCQTYSDGDGEQITKAHDRETPSAVSKSATRARELLEIDRAFKRKFEMAEEAIKKEGVMA